MFHGNSAHVVRVEAKGGGQTACFNPRRILASLHSGAYPICPSAKEYILVTTYYVVGYDGYPR